MIEDEADGVRAGKDVFVRQVVVEDNVNRIEASGVGAVAGKDAGGERALQRGEAENGTAVTAKNELDETVAESADTVVEEEWVGHGIWKTLAAWARRGRPAYIFKGKKLIPTVRAICSLARLSSCLSEEDGT